MLAGRSAGIGDRVPLMQGTSDRRGRFRLRIVELPLVLENQRFVIGGKIGFGILAAECDLANVGQMLFAGIAREPAALSDAACAAS